MIELDEENRQARETALYIKRLIQGGVFLLIVATVFNVLAALFSHIAIWQVLVWLSAICIVVSILFFMAQSWIARNNL